jgi:hypothetical protein
MGCGREDLRNQFPVTGQEIFVSSKSPRPTDFCLLQIAQTDSGLHLHYNVAASSHFSGDATAKE